MNKKDARAVRKLAEFLADEFPRGYDATRDGLMDEDDARDAVNRLGNALREAVEILQRLAGSDTAQCFSTKGDERR